MSLCGTSDLPFYRAAIWFRNAFPLQTVATAELTADEILQIQVFSDELWLEYEAENARPERQYIICPHASDPDEQFRFRRFNCAGFAVEADRVAGIDLVHFDEKSLPTVSVTTLIQAYPKHARRLDNRVLREAYGRCGDGPWPVLLAGYVINAMARETTAIRESPYRARVGDMSSSHRGGPEVFCPTTTQRNA